MAAPVFLMLVGLFASVASRQAKELQPFFSEVLELFNSSSISIVISNDFFQEYDASDVSIRNPTSFLCYTSEGEVGGITERLVLQQFTGDLDLILFLGSDHNELLKRLVNEEKIFNAGVIGLLPHDDYAGTNLVLRLNTKLIFYAWEEGHIILKERYAVREIAVENDVGTWSESAGFEVEKPHIWERRTNLLGSNVVVASLHLPPLHEFYFEDANDETSRITGGGGFFIEPLNYLAKKLNFTLLFNASVDGKFGTVDSNGTWNGLIGMVVAEGGADLAAAALTRTMERDDATSFSITLLEETSTLAAPMSTKPATNLWVYVEIFPAVTWAMCGSMFVAVALGFTVIHASGINSLQDGNESSEEDVNIFNAMGLSALGSTMQLPYDVCVRCLPSRIVFFFAGIGTFVLFAHYTADLTAQMTSGPRQSAIKSFADVKGGDFKVIVEHSTSMHIFLEQSRPGTAMHQVYYDTMKNDPDSFVSGLGEALDVVYANDKTLTFTSSLYDFMADGSRLDFLDIQGHTKTFLLILTLERKTQKRHAIFSCSTRKVLRFQSTG